MTTQTTEFQAYRAAHVIVTAAPTPSPGTRQQPLTARDTVRVLVHGPDRRQLYDSQHELGDDAGLFGAAALALAHGEQWLEAAWARSELRRELADQRRHALADRIAAASRRVDDLRRARSALTGEINTCTKQQRVLADEARDPAVELEWDGARWVAVAAPSVTDGQLDVDGRPAAGDRKGRKSAPAPVHVPEPEPADGSKPPALGDEPPAAIAKRLREAAPAPSTYAAIALDELLRPKSRSRPLMRELEAGLAGTAALEVADVRALTFDASGPIPGVWASARLLTTSWGNMKPAERTAVVQCATDAAVLRWALAAGEAPRKVAAAIKARLAQLGDTGGESDDDDDADEGHEVTH